MSHLPQVVLFSSFANCFPLKKFHLLHLQTNTPADLQSWKEKPTELRQPGLSGSGKTDPDQHAIFIPNPPGPVLHQDPPNHLLADVCTGSESQASCREASDFCGAQKRGGPSTRSEPDPSSSSFSKSWSLAPTCTPGLDLLTTCLGNHSLSPPLIPALNQEPQPSTFGKHTLQEAFAFGNSKSNTSRGEGTLRCTKSFQEYAHQ